MFKQSTSLFNHTKIIEYGKTIDFGKTAQDYAKYRAGFPAEMFRRLNSLYGIGLIDQTVLDLGTGTGTVARSFAIQGCKVTAIDPSVELMEQAKILDQEVTLNHPITYKKAIAEDTELPSAEFDIVAAGTCWHWFDSFKALQEVDRVLKIDGRLVICHFDWLPIPGSLVYFTEQLIKKYNPNWNLDGGTGFYPKWAIDCQIAKFRDIESFSFLSYPLYTHQSWKGRVRASSGVKAILNEQKITEFEVELDHILKTNFPQDNLEIPHRVFAVIATKPKST